MSKTLTEITKQLKDANKRVQLIYAFNGTGKTRLSREFKQSFAPDKKDVEDGGGTESSRNKILYYNAFTEDLFYWDNDLEEDVEPKLKIQPNTFTDWLITLLKEMGEYDNIITNFQRYANNKVTPSFNEEYKYNGTDHSGKKVEITVPAFSEITFQVAAKHPINTDTASTTTTDNGEAKVEAYYEIIKISKGEESNFVWSVFYTLLEQVISTINETDPSNRITNEFDQLEYVFIDDPVSSLDENHLIEVAIDLVKLIKSSKSNLKFIVSTHNALFYNVFCNTFKRHEQQEKGILQKYILRKMDDGLIDVREHNDSFFSYHLHIKEEIENAILNQSLKKYHFNFLRNILEKTAIFLGHSKWQDLLPAQFKDAIVSYEERTINISSHSDYAGDEVVDLNNKAATELKEILDAINSTYNFKRNQ
jgi:hypothetical protein